MAVGDVVELAVTGLAVGGNGVGRDAVGRVTFVAGAVPGDEVAATVTEERRRFVRATVRSLLVASADRVGEPCPEAARGCGGCGLQHLALDAERHWKRRLVMDVLERIGGITDPAVVDGPPLSSSGFRTTLRTAVVDGRAGFRRARSHDVLAVDGCMVAHPLLAELVVHGRFGSAREVTMRAGVASRERLVVVDGPLDGVRLPSDVAVVAASAATGPGVPAVHEVVAGRRWRVSAGSFFQTRPDGAAALVAQVAAELTAGGFVEGTVVDAYSGVGLLSAAAPSARLVAVESNPSSSADAAVNLADRDVTLCCAPVERWAPVPADAVIADPARRGLGRDGVAALAGTGAGALVLVSCDAGSLGRDAALLATHGFRFERATVVDLFPHTPHVEVVSGFRRSGAGRRRRSGVRDAVAAGSDGTAP